MNVSTENVSLAIHNASKGHKSKEQVRNMLENEEAYVKNVLVSIKNETYINRIAYNEFDLTTKVGKHRHIEQPSLFTRVLQHLFIVLIEPLYDKLDPKLSFNCKKGYGVTASEKSRSVLHRIKHIMYERKDLHYALQIDQRKCYEHMYRKQFRKAMKMITDDKELIDFGTNIVFHGKTLPVGTPTSPLAHHIIMLKFDRWLGSINGSKIRYADDCILFFRTKEEANEAKWRIRNFWWYELRILAKKKYNKIDEYRY